MDMSASPQKGPPNTPNSAAGQADDLLYVVDRQILYRQAYYNAAALCLFALVGGAVHQNIVVFEAFLKSLLWASLCGVFLHQLKTWLVKRVDEYLYSHELSWWLTDDTQVFRNNGDNRALLDVHHLTRGSDNSRQNNPTDIKGGNSSIISNDNNNNNNNYDGNLINNATHNNTNINASNATVNSSYRLPFLFSVLILPISFLGGTLNHQSYAAAKICLSMWKWVKRWVHDMQKSWYRQQRKNRRKERRSWLEWVGMVVLLSLCVYGSLFVYMNIDSIMRWYLKHLLALDEAPGPDPSRTVYVRSTRPLPIIWYLLAVLFAAGYLVVSWQRWSAVASSTIFCLMCGFTVIPWLFHQTSTFVFLVLMATLVVTLVQGWCLRFRRRKQRSHALNKLSWRKQLGRSTHSVSPLPEHVTQREDALSLVRCTPPLQPLAWDTPPVRNIAPLPPTAGPNTHAHGFSTRVHSRSVAVRGPTYKDHWDGQRKNERGGGGDRVSAGDGSQARDLSGQRTANLNTQAANNIAAGRNKMTDKKETDKKAKINSANKTSNVDNSSAAKNNEISSKFYFKLLYTACGVQLFFNTMASFVIYRILLVVVLVIFGCFTFVHFLRLEDLTTAHEREMVMHIKDQVKRKGSKRRKRRGKRTETDADHRVDGGSGGEFSPAYPVDDGSDGEGNGAGENGEVVRTDAGTAESPLLSATHTTMPGEGKEFRYSSPVDGHKNQDVAGGDDVGNAGSGDTSSGNGTDNNNDDGGHDDADSRSDSKDAGDDREMSPPPVMITRSVEPTPHSTSSFDMPPLSAIGTEDGGYDSVSRSLFAEAVLTPAPAHSSARPPSSIAHHTDASTITTTTHNDSLSTPPHSVVHSLMQGDSAADTGILQKHDPMKLPSTPPASMVMGHGLRRLQNTVTGLSKRLWARRFSQRVPPQKLPADSLVTPAPGSSNTNEIPLTATVVDSTSPPVTIEDSRAVAPVDTTDNPVDESNPSDSSTEETNHDSTAEPTAQPANHDEEEGSEDEQDTAEESSGDESVPVMIRSPHRLLSPKGSSLSSIDFPSRPQLASPLTLFTRIATTFERMAPHVVRGVRLFWLGFAQLDRSIVSFLRRNINFIVTVTLIAWFLFFGVLFGLLFALQFHSEVSHMLTYGHGMWKQHVSANPYVMNWINETILENEPLWASLNSTSLQWGTKLRGSVEAHLKVWFGDDFNVTELEIKIKDLLGWDTEDAEFMYDQAECIELCMGEDDDGAPQCLDDASDVPQPDNSASNGTVALPTNASVAVVTDSKACPARGLLRPSLCPERCRKREKEKPGVWGVLGQFIRKVPEADTNFLAPNHTHHLANVSDATEYQSNATAASLRDRVMQWVYGVIFQEDYDHNNTAHSTRAHSSRPHPRSWQQFSWDMLTPEALYGVYYKIRKAYHEYQFDFASFFSYIKGAPLTMMRGLYQIPVFTVSLLASSVSQMMDFLFSFVVFVSALYIFVLEREYKPTKVITIIVPGARQQEQVQKAIRRAVSEVFAASLNIAKWHFLCTWVTFSWFGAHFVYIPSVVSAAMGVGVIPVLPPFVICIPLVFSLWFVEERIVEAIILFVIHFLSYWTIGPMIHGEIADSNPYLTALSVVGGITAFGPAGAIVGPILVCILFVAKNIILAFMGGEDYRAAAAGKDNSEAAPQPYRSDANVSLQSPGPKVVAKSRWHPDT